MVDATNLIKKIMIKMSKDRLEVTQEDMYNCLVSMIKWTRQFKNRPEIVQLSGGLNSPLMWSKEFCTIKFCLPRQSGHTTFIKRIVEKFTENGSTGELFKKPVLIFPSMNIIKNEEIFYNGIKFGLVKHINSFNKNTFLGQKLDGAIIDCTSIFSSSEVEKVYEAFKHHAVFNPNFVFVFIE